MSQSPAPRRRPALPGHVVLVMAGVALAGTLTACGGGASPTAPEQQQSAAPRVRAAETTPPDTTQRQQVTGGYQNPLI